MMLLTAPDLRIVSFGGARLVQRPDGLRERMDVRTAELLTSCRTLRQRGEVEEHYSAALTQTLLDRGLLVEERTLWSAQEIRAVLSLFSLSVSYLLEGRGNPDEV